MIVEDDRTISGVLASELEKWHYTPYQVTDFQTILEQFQAEEPQLVLMDIQLPAFNGYHWCQEIRKLSQVPIIFIFIFLLNMYVVMAIQMGGDDYIQKPFDLSVVLAKIQAVLRRTYDFNEWDNFLKVGDVVLRSGESKVVFNDHSIDLTRNELKVMELLFQQKNRYVSREDIMVRLWEDESFIDDNTLAVLIARLRKKLKQVGLDQFIVTKKGLGYSVQEDEQ